MDELNSLGTLVPCGGGDPIPLLKRRLLIGRRSSCDIRLDFPNVSSHHCELELLNGHWHIRDLNSSNGIKVNHERCPQKYLLPGDILTIARHSYELVYQATGAQPQVEEEDPFARSLLEKAGLSRDEERRPPAAAPRATAPTQPVKKSALASQDDEAMKWLTDDEDS